MKRISFDANSSPDTLPDFLSRDDESKGDIVIPIGFTENYYLFENYRTISGSLIGGTTGSGKTAFVKTLLLEIMCKYTPAEVAFVICDTRGVDYSFMDGNPFLAIPIIHSSREAISVLKWLTNEAKNTENRSKRPHLFIIFDDYSELSGFSELIIDQLIYLLRLARHAKFHFWLITSTPSASFLPSDLKDNIMQKISFHTTSWTISKMILGETGAEKLDAPGEMMVKLFGDTEKCNSVYMNEEFIERIFTETNSVNNDVSISSSSLIQPKENSHEGELFGEDDHDDELLAEAAKVVLDSGVASIAMIQRKVRIGYARSARLVDLLEEKGVVGEFDGSRPRKILMTKKQVASLFSNDLLWNEKNEQQQQTMQDSISSEKLNEQQQQTMQDSVSSEKLSEKKFSPKAKHKNIITDIIAWFKGED